jgi:hypothetical protein
VSDGDGTGCPPAPEGQTYKVIADLVPLVRPVGDLALDPANAMKHPDRNYQATKASLQRFGQRLPIVVRASTMTIEAGNLRYQIALDLGWTHVAAVVVDDDALTAAAYAITDNRTPQLARWDNEALGATLAALKDEFDTGLGDLGWADFELEPLLLADWTPPAPSSSDPPPETHALKFSSEQWTRLSNELADLRAEGYDGSDQEIIITALAQGAGGGE